MRAVTKHLVDLDDEALNAARAELGTRAVQDTVNEALRLTASTRGERVSWCLDVLAGTDLGSRDAAWR